MSSWFGIYGVGLDWFKSYLSDHSESVKIVSILSDAKKFLSGLSYVQYSLYITPLRKVIQNHQIVYPNQILYTLFDPLGDTEYFVSPRGIKGAHNLKYCTPKQNLYPLERGY